MRDGDHPLNYVDIPLVLARIPFRESVAVRLRHESGLALKDVGVLLGVTRERARQIILHGERRVWKKMTLAQYARGFGERPRDWVRDDYSGAPA